MQANDDRIVQLAARERLKRLRSWMEQQQLDGLLITRRDNFAWLTCGGDNHVLKLTEYGSVHLLITPGRQYLLAYPMDADRVLTEQIPGQGYEPVVVKWYQGDPRSSAFALASRRIAADAPFPETRTVDLSRLHGPLNALELERSRWLGQETAAILEGVARWMRPGMTEEEIGRQMQTEAVARGIEAEVIIVGSDERIKRYWHALPSSKRVQQYALTHLASRRWGLHANVNRLVSFGEPPRDVAQAHRAAVTIQGRLLGMLAEGVCYASILEQQKRWYAELGHPGDWEMHFQGGPTGYVVGDPNRCWTEMQVQVNEAFDWFITVGGVQVEELVLLTAGGVEVASMGTSWPTTSVATAQGEIVVPGIYVR